MLNDYHSSFQNILIPISIEGEISIDLIVEDYLRNYIISIK